jgi:prepilin peptidase CpaA
MACLTEVQAQRLPLLERIAAALCGRLECNPPVQYGPHLRPNGEDMSFFLPIGAVSWSASLMLLAVSAATDLKDRRIPNELVAAVAAIGLTQGLLARPGQVWLSLFVALIVFCGLGVLSHYRIIGGGDLKLISAVTLLVPPERVGQLLIEIALAGGVLSCVYLVARYALKSPSAASSGAAEVARPGAGFALAIKTERVRIAMGDPLPYALAILGGVLIYGTRELV